MPAPAAPRPAGRMWTVRIVPRGRPAEGVTGLECSAPGCSTTGTERHRVPAQARTAALAHLTTHARRAGAVRARAFCRCRNEGCAWHTAPGRCGGPVCLAVVPDRLGRVWRLAEVCARCADVIPHTKIVSTAAPEPTAVPGDFTAPAAEAVGGPAEDAPQKGPPRDPKPSAGDQMSVDERLRLARKVLGRDLAGDVERALGCALCADEGVVNRIPEPRDLPRRLRLTLYARRRTLTGRQTAVLQAAIDRVARSAPPSGPDVRLAAVWWGVRAIWCGEVELSAPKLERIPIPGISTALNELAASGWLRADLDEVAATDDVEPALAVIPDLAGHDPALWLGRDAVTHVGAWMRRLLRHPLLAEASPVHRLAALYLTAHARPDRHVAVPLQALTALSAADCAGAAETAVAGLHQDCWLSDPPETADGLLSTRLSTTAAAVISPSPAVYEPVQYQQADPAEHERGAALIDGRQADIARWVECYRARHGHGPSWRTLRNAHLDHSDPLRMEPAHSKAVKILCRSGWLVGVGRPYGLRPGWRYREAAPAAAARPER